MAPQRPAALSGETAAGDLLLGLDGACVNRLERLALVARRRVRGGRAGIRQSLDGGHSAEFMDYRTYTPGDDLRRLDWAAYARLERLFLRLFEAEENTTLHLFLDCSGSMDSGEPQKMLRARQLAAALSYIALAAYDRVAVTGTGDGSPRVLPPRSGRDQILGVWRFIAALPCGGRTDLHTLRSFEQQAQRPGLALVLSDLLTTSDWRRGIRALQGAFRQEVTLVQILSPQELRPILSGDRALVDRETEQTVEVSLSPAVLRRYQASLQTYTAEISAWCRRNNVRFVQISSSQSVEELTLRLLPRLGVLR